MIMAEVLYSFWGQEGTHRKNIQKEHGRVPIPLQFFCDNVYLGVELLEKLGPPAKPVFLRDHSSQGHGGSAATVGCQVLGCRISNEKLSDPSSCSWGAQHSLDRPPGMHRITKAQTPLALPDTFYCNEMLSGNVNIAFIL